MDFSVLVVLAIGGGGLYALFMSIFRPEQWERSMQRHHEKQML